MEPPAAAALLDFSFLASPIPVSSGAGCIPANASTDALLLAVVFWALLVATLEVFIT